MTRVPSTQALRALEAFSRHGTVWAAADELHLTRSAVSHQLRQLESGLGFALFNRVGKNIELTARGQEFAKDVRGALSAIVVSAARNAGQGLQGNLTVSCTPGFAATWLAPKIGRFRKTCPKISLRIVTPRALEDVSNPNADVFIAFGDGNIEGVSVELLREVEFTPMVSPVLLNRLGGLKEPTGVLRAGLLHLSGEEDWRNWMQAAGLPPDAAETGIVFADMNLVYAAAVKAQGIAMGDEFITYEAMEAGQLVRPFSLSIKSPKSYFLAISPEKTEFETVQAFRQWILDEMPRTTL